MRWEKPGPRCYAVQNTLDNQGCLSLEKTVETLWHWNVKSTGGQSLLTKTIAILMIDVGFPSIEKTGEMNR